MLIIEENSYATKCNKSIRKVFWKKRIGSILKQLFLFKFKKLFSCMAFQHLQNREKGTENSHKYC